MLRRSSTRHAPIQAHATPPTALRATLGLQLMIWAPPPHWLRSAGITQEPTRSQHLRRSLATPQSASMPAPTRKSASHLLEDHVHLCTHHCMRFHTPPQTPLLLLPRQRRHRLQPMHRLPTHAPATVAPLPPFATDVPMPAPTAMAAAAPMAAPTEVPTNVPTRLPPWPPQQPLPLAAPTAAPTATPKALR